MRFVINYFIKNHPLYVKRKRKNEGDLDRTNMVNVVCPSRYKISRPNIKSETDRLLRQADISANYDLNIIFVGRTKMKWGVAREFFRYRTISSAKLSKAFRIAGKSIQRLWRRP